MLERHIGDHPLINRKGSNVSYKYVEVKQTRRTKMDLVVELVTTFWQWAILAVLVGVGFVVSHFDGQGEERVGFKHDTMPKMHAFAYWHRQTKGSGRAFGCG